MVSSIVLLDKIQAILDSHNETAIGALSAEVSLVYEYAVGATRETDQCSELPRQ